MDKPMNEREDCITMITDSGESVDFYVLEETRIHGKDYLLVTDAPEDVSGENDSEALFEFVEDDRELDGVMGIFEELLKDADVELEK